MSDRMIPINRFRLVEALDRSAERRLEDHGAAVEGTLVICPAGTTYHVVQNLVALRFDEGVIVFHEDDVILG